MERFMDENFLLKNELSLYSMISLRRCQSLIIIINPKEIYENKKFKISPKHGCMVIIINGVL